MQPFLLSIGFSKALTAIVWISGPLAGMLIQPVVGAMSDHGRHLLVRRKSLVLGGSLGSAACILCLAFCQEIAMAFAHMFGSGAEACQLCPTATMILAICCLAGLHISLQPLQSGIRALAIERCPAHQQIDLSAWISRFNGLGSVFTFFLGSLLSTSGSVKKFQTLCLIAIAALATTASLSLLSIQEAASMTGGRSEGHDDPSNTTLSSLLRTARRLPHETSVACKIQFFSWLGWFPFLYYHTT